MKYSAFYRQAGVSYKYTEPYFVYDKVTVVQVDSYEHAFYVFLLGDLVCVAVV